MKHHPVLFFVAASLAAAPASARNAHVAVKFIPAGAADQATSATVAPKGTAIKVKFGVQTLLAEYYEYNPDTCAEISPGMWSVTSKPPAHGQVSYTSEPYTVPQGDDCAGMTFTTAAIDYTWTDADTKKKRDKFSAAWTTPDGEFDYPFSAKLRLVK